MAAITNQELTETTLGGEGVFDYLMRATKAHLDEEYQKNRIRGPEYSRVYLGALQSVMQYAVQFALEKQRADKQAELLAAQVITEGKQQELLTAQIAKTADEQALIQQQISNLAAEALNIPKQGALLDAQVAKTSSEQALVDQQTTNAVTQNTVLIAEECKLRAEYDVLLEQRLKTVEETGLLGQKKATERAQTVGTGVDTDSIIGRQKSLYQAQADGFLRDAEQRAAKVLVDSWNVRRTTDEGTQANTSNQLDDASVGRAVGRLLQGVNA